MLLRRLYLLFPLVLILCLAEGRSQVSEEQKAEIITSALDQLVSNYVFPEVGEKMASHVRRLERKGAYAEITALEELGRALTKHLRSISRDLHLRVFVSGASRARARNQGASESIVRAEVLAGNIGYLRISRFAGPNQLSQDLEVAMQQLAETDALLIDLRDNGGGSPASVMLLAGYLIPKRTLVAHIYSRPNDHHTEMWTTVVDRHHFRRDVFILTNESTFSAAEAAAYHLKHLGRAKTVGENSGGGAHRVTRATLPHGMAITLPYTRPINVVTKGDWEGAGVQADIVVPSAEALKAGHLAALQALPPSPARNGVIRDLSGR